MSPTPTIRAANAFSCARPADVVFGRFPLNGLMVTAIGVDSVGSVVDVVVVVVVAVVNSAVAGGLVPLEFVAVTETL